MKTRNQCMLFLCGTSTLALALGATTIPQFDADILAARLNTSAGGTSVTRLEMQNALSRFVGDDGQVDSDERAHLVGRLADAAWKININGPALKYAQDFLEVNEQGPIPSIAFDQIVEPPSVLFGANGALAGASAVAQGFIPRGTGLATQATLQQGYLDAFNASPSLFLPVNARELLERLAQATVSGVPFVDEIDGAFAYLNQISRNSSRLYLASWKSPGRGAPGDLGGYVVAAVSSDRRTVRFIEVTTWVE
jgi:hypothetical protein